MRRGPDGWQISPTLNLLLIAALVGVVWLLTESPTTDPAARKRLLSLRANIALVLLATWFLLGPSIGAIEESALTPTVGTARSPLASSETSPAGNGPSVGSSLSHGHTNQYTWRQAPRSSPPAGWRPGDGLRAMAQLLEDVAAPPTRGR